MVNPVFAQRKLRAEQAAKAKNAPPPPPEAKAVNRAPKAVKPAEPKVALETLPDGELKAKAKILYGTDYDPAWDRDALIAKLLDKGATA